MGKAMIVYKVYPEENVNLKELETNIKKIEKVREVREDAIGFGIILLRVAMVIDDKTEKPETYEDMLKKTKGVKDIETEDVTLIS